MQPHSNGDGPPGQGRSYLDCPICGRAKREQDCGLRGGVIHCFGSETHAPYGYRYIGPSKIGSQMFVEDDDSERRRIENRKIDPPARAKKKSGWDSAKDARKIYELNGSLPSANERLAARLNIPYSALEDGDVRFASGREFDSFYMPRYNVSIDGRITWTSYAVRKVEWEGKDVKRSRGGGQAIHLFGAHLDSFTLSNKPDFPILAPEGFTSSAPLYGAGFDVVGRTNNATGGTNVARIAMPHAGRGVLLIADNDKNGAGVSGARRTASEMVDAGFPSDAIRITVPRSVKDTRDAWITAAPGCWDDRRPDVQERLAQWGESYVAELLADARPWLEWQAGKVADTDAIARALFADSKLELPPPTPKPDKPAKRRRICGGVGLVMVPRYDALGLPVAFYAPCRLIACDRCRPGLVKQCRQTVQSHLGKLAPRSKVFAVEVQGEAYWDRCVRAFKQKRKRLRTAKRRESVEFMRVGPDLSTGRSYALMTWCPEPARESAKAMTPAKAAKWLVGHLDTFERMPWDSDGRVFFSTSAGWPRVTDENRKRGDPRFRTVGRLKRGVKPEAVFQEHGLDIRHRTVGEVMFVEAVVGAVRSADSHLREIILVAMTDGYEPPDTEEAKTELAFF